MPNECICSTQQIFPTASVFSASMGPSSDNRKGSTRGKLPRAKQLSSVTGKHRAGHAMQEATKCTAALTTELTDMRTEMQAAITVLQQQVCGTRIDAQSCSST